MSATTAPEMVGRDAELALLHEALRAAERGEPASALIAGEAGIGKSRLTSEFRRQLVDEATVLTGWCLDYGSTPAPFGPLPAILRGLLDELGERADAAAGPSRNALQLLLPDPAATPLDRSSVRPEALGETIANLLEAASAARPVVVIVEDLHWADAATLSMLSFLLRALAGRRVLFVLTCRTDEVRRGGAVRTFLAESERARLLERITLPRLDASAVRELVVGLRGPMDDATIARLLQRSEGVPFFVEELVCNAEGPLPETLRDVLLARFDALGDDARRTVRLASACDGAIAHDLLAAVSGRTGESLDEALREAVVAGILTVRDDDSYAFRHALLREAIHDDLLPGERARLHRSYAKAIQAAGGAASSLAFHWHQAHDPERALEAAVRAMQQAKDSYAFSTAARFGELALELWDQVPDADAVAGIGRIPFLARLGSILRNGGDAERALTVVTLALDELHPRTADPALHARLLRDRALYLQNLGKPGTVELLGEALTILDGHLDEDQLRASLLNYLSGRYLTSARLAEAIETTDEAFRIAEASGFDNAMSVAANLRGCSRIHLGDVDAGLADLRVSWQHASDHDAQLRYRVNYADALHNLGRFREAVEVAQLGVTHSRRLGVERATGSVLAHNLVEPLIELGEIDRAEEAMSRDLALRTLQIFRVYATMSRIRILVWRGRIAEATQLLNEWRPIAAAISDVERQVWFSLRSVELLVNLGAGDSMGAAGVLTTVIDDPGPPLAQVSRLLLEGARVVTDLRADGHHTVADATAHALSTAWNARPPALRIPHWDTVLTAVLSGDIATLRAALPVAENDDVPAIFRPVLRLELARLQLTAGDRVSAAEQAATASELANALGHQQVQQRAASFIRDAGLARVTRHDAVLAPASDALTAREQQVLDLVAEGLTNRQIGERLFISAKTASVHVSAILRKLGVASRTEAAVASRR
ncbi:AAA family ATPase [Microbacterium sp. ZW T5_56]|uniref:helix-turn-helix transcriptional regulator n=1 Tax=Microbacterium sp. ZW T5_56 TaxID=3378081 RepID=UPI003851C32A